MESFTWLLAVTLLANVALSSGASDFLGSVRTQAANGHSMIGIWGANIAESTLHPSYRFHSATIQFEVTPSEVRITDRVIVSSGQAETHGTTIFQTDGKEHAFDGTPLGTGVVSVAQWLTPRTLETIIRKDGKEVTRVIYEVSADGMTLTARRTGMLEQTILFERR